MDTHDLSDILSISEDLVKSPEHKLAAQSSLDFDGLLKQPLQLHEDLANGCGGQLWPAGMTLTKYLLRTKRESLQDCSIVELGAGGGLVGLAIAVGCNTQQLLHITDQAVMFDLMQKNIQLNDLDMQVRASIYDWGTTRPENIPAQPDVILAADCVYFEPAFEPLHQTLKDLIGDRTICYFCFKKRRRADLHFMKAIRKDFDVAEILDDQERETYSRENIFLYTIKKKQAKAAQRLLGVEE